MSEVELKQIVKIFPGSTKALDEINLKVKDRELMVILGPSGCGKTTLLNIISGLDKDFDGQISRYDKASDISYMFQSPRLFPWLTTIENIKYPIKENKNSEKIEVCS